jgi:hypothetical protein
LRGVECLKYRERPMLEIKNLHAKVDDNEILRGVNPGRTEHDDSDCR